MQMEKIDSCIKLDISAEFVIGETTIIATAHYPENKEDCFSKIKKLLKEEVRNSPLM